MRNLNDPVDPGDPDDWDESYLVIKVIWWKNFVKFYVCQCIFFFFSLFELDVFHSRRK